jgi:signal recognition particle subunit SRP54
MFGLLAQKLQSIVSRLSGQKSLTEENISEAVAQVRLALLEADVNYGVAKSFVARVKERAVGQQLLKAVSPGQQFIKIVHDELTALMGDKEPQLILSGRPTVLLLCGLQGSGKTTCAAKLACYFRKAHDKKRPLLAACDLQRPAASEQLQTLGAQAQIDVFTLPGARDPLAVARAAHDHAKQQGHDLLIIDSAGRLHVDEPLMAELKALQKAVAPHLTLFVANATTGQDAVNSAKAIADAVQIDGSILTMLDGDARAGAAISIRQVTGKPLLFEGIGERLEDLQLFHPVSMADRILGMADTINLVKRAQEFVSEEEAAALNKKLRKAAFTFSDYLEQLGKFEKMGSLSRLAKMLPATMDTSRLGEAESNLARLKAIICSMTLRERDGVEELNMGRRRRIAKGSGTSLDDVNRLIKQFSQAKLLLRDTSKRKALGKILGGGAWR